MHRSDPWQNTWSADVHNTGTTAASFSAYAVCGGGLTGYQVVTGSAVNVDTSPVDAYAYCPAGMSILGGGDWISGPLNVQLYASDFPYLPSVITDSYPTLPNSWTAWDYPTYEGSEPTIAFENDIICGS